MDFPPTELSWQQRTAHSSKLEFQGHCAQSCQAIIANTIGNQFVCENGLV
jgi:hypothetical protein